jgi:hypothetical protein
MIPNLFVSLHRISSRCRTDAQMSQQRSKAQIRLPAPTLLYGAYVHFYITAQTQMAEVPIEKCVSGLCGVKNC